MKKFNYRTLAITGLMCLLPMILGIALYNKLPEEMAFHFDMNNNADRYVSKNIVVFGFPILMLLLQVFMCVVSCLNSRIKGSNPKLVRVMIWFIPILTIVIYITTIVYALGTELNILNIVCFIVGIMIIIIGNYLPKIQAGESINIKPKVLIENEKVWRRTNKVIGYSLVIAGILTLLSIFLPPVFSIGAFLLLGVVGVMDLIYVIYAVKSIHK